MFLTAGSAQSSGLLFDPPNKAKLSWTKLLYLFSFGSAYSLKKVLSALLDSLNWYSNLTVFLFLLSLKFLSAEVSLICFGLYTLFSFPSLSFSTWYLFETRKCLPESRMNLKRSPTRMSTVHLKQFSLESK
jgi:hypothetical protein